MKFFRTGNKRLRCLAVPVMLAGMTSLGFTKPAKKETVAIVHGISSYVEEKMAIYDSLDLGSLGLSREAFAYGLTGFRNLVSTGKLAKDNLLSILDFSLPSSKKRLFVIDLASGELIYHTYASHGKKSGQALPTQFSNKTNSNKSSLGFYVTGDTYQGKHGESLRLLGEEHGFNDNALKRGIVMHSASYVDESIIEKQGFIGRSQGCPAIPKNVYKEVIATIKEGSCLFIYSPDKYYVTHSKLLHQPA